MVPFVTALGSSHLATSDSTRSVALNMPRPSYRVNSEYLSFVTGSGPPGIGRVTLKLQR